ncbi:CLUMA_CG011728, isoform A, partial [Clunio marinus]
LELGITRWKQPAVLVKLKQEIFTKNNGKEKKRTDKGFSLLSKLFILVHQPMNGGLLTNGVWHINVTCPKKFF